MDLLQKLLSKMRDVEATDLLLSAGTPPAFLIHGKLATRRGNSLFSLYQRNWISQDIALDYADSPSNLKLRIKLQTQPQTGTE